MIVMKFGGSSLANAERIRNIIDIVKSRQERSPAVILSALGDTTDHLLEAADNAINGSVDVEALREFHKQVASDLGVEVPEIDTLLDELKNVLTGISLTKELSAKSKDYIVSFGERLSVRIISAFANTQELNTNYFDAWDLGVSTTNTHGNADMQESCHSTIKERIEACNCIPIITGYIGKDDNGAITTFGRGGSDLSASLIGVAIQADEVQLWKDVNGIMTTDPRIVKEAQSIERMTFQEAAELSYFGAKVLHPRSVVPAAHAGIPVRIRNSYNPEHPGTMLINEDQQPGLRAITYKKGVVLVDIMSSRMLGQHGFMATLFEIFSRHKVSVDLVATSEVSVTVSLDSSQDLQKIQEDLKDYAHVKILKDRSVISLVGNVSQSSQILGDVFTTMTKNNINVQMLSQGASKANIGLVVDDAQAETCITELHKVFFE